MILPNLGDASGIGVTKVPLDYDRVSKRYPQCSSEPSGTAAGEYTKVCSIPFIALHFLRYF